MPTLRRGRKGVKSRGMTTLTMPALGESIVEGTIGKWLVREGDRVEKNQPVVEILTDKADSEIPSPEAGVIRKILAQEGDVVQVGGNLCEIEAGARKEKPGAGAGTGAGTTGSAGNG